MFNSITFANANISSSLTLLDISKCSLSKYKKQNNQLEVSVVCVLFTHFTLYDTLVAKITYI